MYGDMSPGVLLLKSASTAGDSAQPQSLIQQPGLTALTFVKLLQQKMLPCFVGTSKVC